MRAQVYGLEDGYSSIRTAERTVYAVMQRAPLFPITAARCEALTFDRGASYFSLGPVRGAELSKRATAPPVFPGSMRASSGRSCQSVRRTVALVRRGLQGCCAATIRRRELERHSQARSTSRAGAATTIILFSGMSFGPHARGVKSNPTLRHRIWHAMGDGGLDDAVVRATHEAAEWQASEEKQREAEDAELAQVRQANQEHYDRAMQAARACAQRARAAKIPATYIKWTTQETIDGIFGRRVKERKYSEKLWCLRNSHLRTREESFDASSPGWYLTVDGRLLQGWDDTYYTSFSDFSPYSAELADELILSMARLLSLEMD